MNNVLKRVFLERFEFCKNNMAQLGQIAHRFEVRINRRIVSLDTKQTDLYIKPLSKEAAFNKGVEWFTEVIFLYLVIFLIGAYEAKKSHDSHVK